MKVTDVVTSDVTDIDGERRVYHRLTKRKSSLYITRSGNAFVFQMRLPRHFCSGKNIVMRLSLGPCSYVKARYISDLLAGEARLFIERRGEQMKEEAPKRTTNPADLMDGETPESNAMALKTYIKMMHDRISDSSGDGPKFSLGGFEGIKGMVAIAKELQAQSEGAPPNFLITENLDFLRDKYSRLLLGSTTMESENPSEVSKPMAAVAQKPVLNSSSAKEADGETSDVARAPGRRSIAPWIIAAISAGKMDKPKRHPDYDLDRRLTSRSASEKPLFSEIAEEYFTERSRNTIGNTSQVTTERARADLFLALIGDHPVDSYSSTDLKAYLNALKYWPAQPKDRSSSKSFEEIIIDNVDLHLMPLARKTVLDGYVSIIKRIVGSATTSYDYKSPLAGLRMKAPDTARPSKPTTPLSTKNIGDIFRTGTEIGYMDTVMLPLLGHLTGRRIGLLTYLQGIDIQLKFPGVYVANISGIVFENGSWKRIPYKTDASVAYFILHDFLREIGFVDWAMAQGQRFLFPTLTDLVDPAKSASSYMQRLFAKAGVQKGTKEVFHSLRGGNIDDLRDQNVDKRTTKLQSGHELGQDTHEMYGSREITEKKARHLAKLPLNSEIDFAVFKGLDFDSISKKRRTAE